MNLAMVKLYKKLIISVIELEIIHEFVAFHFFILFGVDSFIKLSN